MNRNTNLADAASSTPRPASPARPADFVEEGAAFDALTRAGDGFASPNGGEGVERYEVIVIGGGQAGLSVGHHLARHGMSFVILEADARVGDVWRRRWDSLHLFTPRRFDALDGLAFPGDPHDFPTKDEMADYLEGYVRHFRLPVRTGMRVERLMRSGDRYIVIAGGKRFEAAHVVVAMATYQQPRVPAFAGELDPAIVQIHSLDYRRPSQLPRGRVLIVGAGNSGAEIAMDLARAGYPVSVSGRNVGEVPFPVRSRFVRQFLLPIVFRFVFHRVLSLDNPIGRNARHDFITKGTPLIRTRAADLRAAGVERVVRTRGVENGMPVLEDGRRLDVTGVVWCTGFHLGPAWIELPVFGTDGEPIQTRGVVPNEPGFYFVGPHFLYAASSTMIHGIGRDAAFVADAIAARRQKAAA